MRFADYTGDLPMVPARVMDGRNPGVLHRARNPINVGGVRLGGKTTVQMRIVVAASEIAGLADLEHSRTVPAHAHPAQKIHHI